MRGAGLQIESKLLLICGAILLVVLYFGSGSLSYQEAKSNADRDRAAISAGQLSSLEKKQARFAAQAIPSCVESTGVAPDNFTVVVEIGADGRVARSWRQGDSNFVICFQRIMNDYFEFRAIEQPFFAAFEYTAAS